MRRVAPPWKTRNKLNKRKIQESGGKCCGKEFRFATEDAALDYVARIQGTSTSEVKPGRVYICGQGWWHMSSTPNRSGTSGPAQPVRHQVLAREQNACARCGEALSIYSVHHRLPRKMGGRPLGDVNELSNLLALCGSGTTGCHSWVEKNRTEAHKLGFLVHEGEDPEAVPVAHALYGRVFLLDDGTVREG